MRSLRGLVAATAAALALALAGCAPAAAPTSPSARPMPSGVVGAAQLDEGHLQVGTGPVGVDLYFDALCPICGAFEKANGDALAALAASGSITLRLHPMTFLDRASQGTQYSTRAASALTCVAAQQPAKTLDFFGALYAHQPEEGSAGLQDDELAGLAAGVGADVADCITEHRYASWAQRVNQQALDGPIPGSDLPSISGTPTLLRDGVLYQGSPLDAAALSRFLGAGSPESDGAA